MLQRLRNFRHISRGIVDDHDLTLARSIFGLGRERRGQAERIGPTLVVDNDDGQPRSAAIGGSGLMGSKRLVHMVNPKGPPDWLDQRSFSE